MFFSLNLQWRFSKCWSCCEFRVAAHAVVKTLGLNFKRGLILCILIMVVFQKYFDSGKY